MNDVSALNNPVALSPAERELIAILRSERIGSIAATITKLDGVWTIALSFDGRAEGLSFTTGKTFDQAWPQDR